MINLKRLRMPLDILMTLLSIVLMGGAYLFPADILHEILGVVLFVLWAVHIALNRRWYGAMFRGKYNAFRILQSIVNCCILICVIFLVVSGIILSNHVFAPLHIESGLGFARIAHLLASHWYYLFMSLHIGLHVEMIATKIKSRNEHFPTIVLRLCFVLLSAYGIYAFVTRGVWKYLLLQQQFFFIDLEKGYLMFALDYIAILALFATLSHFINKFLKEKKI